MKKTLTFLLIVLLSFGLSAQVDFQQDLLSIKKQVNAIKFDNSRLKKQFNESTTDLNSKIISVEKLLQNANNSIKTQTTTIAKNSSEINEIKDTTKTSFNFVSVIAWGSLILLLIVFAYITFIKMKWNKTKEELFTKINELKQLLDNFIIYVNDSVDMKIIENKKIMTEQMVSSQVLVEKTINLNYKTTNESLQSLNSFVQEAQKSNVEQLDNFKIEMEHQNKLLKEELKVETAKILLDNSKNIASLNEEMEKLKVSKNIAIKTSRTRKDTKQV